MRLTTMAGLVTMAAAGLAWAADCRAGDEPKKAAPPRPAAKARPPRRETITVIDPDWRPVAGMQSRVRVEEAMAAGSRRIYDDLFAERVADRREGTRMAGRPGGVLVLPYGTPVLIVADHQAGRSANPEMFPVEVRVTGGDHAGKILFVARDDIAWTVMRPVMPSFRPGDRATVAGPWSVISGHPDHIEIYGTATTLGNPQVTAEMFRDGRVTRVAGGVKVVVLGVADEIARVRIHSGSKMAGSTGFMPRADLVPVPAK